MAKTRVLIVVIGIFLPYLARLPGVLSQGWEWLTSYLGTDVGVILFFNAFNAISWGSILATTRSYRSMQSVWFPAVLGFGFLAFAHAILNLATDAQASIALIFIPIYSLPIILVGWLIGLWFDRKVAMKKRPKVISHTTS